MLRTFPQGSKITIIEPFYKIAADGLRTVRADDPANVILTPPPSQPRAGLGLPEREGGLEATIEQSRKSLKEGAPLVATAKHVLSL